MDDKLLTGNKLLQCLWYAAGAVFICVFGSYSCWGTVYFWLPYAGVLPASADKWFFLSGVICSYAAAFLIAGRIVLTPLCKRVPSVFLGVSSGFALFIILIFLLRAYYSRSFLIIAFAASFFWLYIGQRLFFSANQIRYGFAHGSVIQELKSEWRDNFIEIKSPDSGEEFDTLVVSPYMENPLPQEWTRYITNMMIEGTPVVHPGKVYEFFAGRLPLQYMIDGPGVTIRPPRIYFRVKYLCDWVMLTIVGIPSLLCIGVISLAILISSGGPVFFVQERIGKNGAPFRMIKFRSMTGAGEITAIGRVLRKYRLDELPQILNVLKGEMSFIGPRPETPELTRLYTEKITFYPYRYSIPPGITGWAQVNYGYASVTSENRIKLSYDLYYVKHASFLLDILIILKTIKTILIGFGAR